MRISISMVAIVLGATSVIVASPLASPMVVRRQDTVGSDVAQVGRCPTYCWNEAALEAGCDPNADNACLCGPFFDLVTDCTSQACSTGDNLAALSFLQPACV